jgi:Ni,Fe-hydrogenase I cytochrome b subunit
MTNEARKMSGVILCTVPTIVYGGYFLLTILSGHEDELHLTEFQKAMFRAGHAHAGVLVILSLIAQVFTDHAHTSNFWKWISRISFPLSAILVSMGFFFSAIGDQLTKPNSLVFILYIGMAILTLGLLTLGIALIRNKQ